MRCIVCGKEINDTYGGAELMGAYCKNCAADLKDNVASDKVERAEHDKNIYCRALYNLAVKYVVADNITTIVGDDGNEYRAGQEVCALSVMAHEVKRAEKELREGK